MAKIKLFLFLWITQIAVGPAMGQRSGLEISIDENNRPVVHHTLEQGQTIYGISKSYDVDLDVLVAQLSDTQVDELKIGQDIVVPIDKNKICYRNQDCADVQRIPIYYKARRQDNLFRIARIYFNTSVEQIKLNNHMTNSLLSDNQVLTIGWLPYRDEWLSYLSPKQMEAIAQVTPQDMEISDIPSPETISEDESVFLTMHEGQDNEVNSVLEELVANNNSKPERIFMDDELHAPVFNPDNRKLITTGATAYWNKNRSSKKGFYLLHKTLPVNTLIQINNPVTQQTVLAKVVGKIPDNIYSPEISVVVTTEVARALGVIDQKFYTKITFPELD